MATQPGDTSRLNTLNLLALTYMYELSDTKKVGEISKELLELSEKLHYKKGIAWAFLHISIYRKSIGETDTAIADCTGHGVSGAFMSLLGYNMLENEIKKDVQLTPGMILSGLNEEMIHHLHKNGHAGDNKHGMDISLVSIDIMSHTLQFSGAHHSLYIIRNKQLIELKGNKKGIGFNDSHHIPFTDHIFQLEKGDLLYAFTDGFPDQIGGSNRKKFFYQPFKDLLISICELPLEDQQKHLDQAHREWMGTRMDQTDDILILGIQYEI